MFVQIIKASLNPKCSAVTVNLLKRNTYMFSSKKNDDKPINNEKQKQKNVQKKSLNNSNTKKGNQLKNMFEPIVKKSRPNESNQLRKLQLQQQRRLAEQQQRINNIYLELQSLPSDSIEGVVQNYKRMKSKLMDRRYYVPNKKQLLLRMDSNMEYIKQIHQSYQMPVLGETRRLTDNKKQALEYQLQLAKRNYYLSLLSNEKVLIAGASLGIAIITFAQWFRYVRVQDTRQKIPSPQL